MTDVAPETDVAADLELVFRMIGQGRPFRGCAREIEFDNQVALAVAAHSRLHYLLLRAEQENRAILARCEEYENERAFRIDDIQELQDEVARLREALREIAEDYHCIVVEPDPDAGQHLDGCVGCFASAALSEPPCYCAETSTRNCPRHAA